MLVEIPTSFLWKRSEEVLRCIDNVHLETSQRLTITKCNIKINISIDNIRTCKLCVTYNLFYNGCVMYVITKIINQFAI